DCRGRRSWWPETSHAAVRPSLERLVRKPLQRRPPSEVRPRERNHQAQIELSYLAAAGVGDGLAEGAAWLARAIYGQEGRRLRGARCRAADWFGDPGAQGTVGGGFSAGSYSYL